MREIKFRAWDKTKNEMNYKVCVGNTDHNDINYTCNLLLVDDEIEGGKKWTHADEICIDLMQFAGLLDKNGKEIYESDIVMFVDNTTLPETPTECITVVFWWEEMACFSLKNTYHEFNFTTSSDMEVIGNIYETPELLKP